METANKPEAAFACSHDYVVDWQLVGTPDAARYEIEDCPDVNCANVPELRLGQRFRLRMAAAMENFPLSAIPRSGLRRQLLEQVDRKLRRISRRA